MNLVPIISDQTSYVRFAIRIKHQNINDNSNKYVESVRNIYASNCDKYKKITSIELLL